MVDKDSVDSVVDEKPPSEWKAHEYLNSPAHVNLILMNWFDQYDLRKRRGVENPAEDEEWQSKDDVGWRKVSVRSIYPRVFVFCLEAFYEDVSSEIPPGIERLF